MTALYIILGIILFIFILLWFPVVCDISYMNKKFTLKVKYLFITFFSVPSSKKKKKRSKKASVEENKESSDESKNNTEKSKESSDNEEEKSSDKTDKKASEEKTKTEKSVKSKKEIDEDEEDDEELLTGKKKDEKKDKKSSLVEKLDLVKEVFASCKKNIFGILKNISFTNISYKCVAATGDAAETALMYGKISACVWNVIAFMQTIVRKFKVKKIDIKTDFLGEETTHDLSLEIKITPAVILWHLVIIVIKFLVIKNRKENENGKQQG